MEITFVLPFSEQVMDFTSDYSLRFSDENDLFVFTGLDSSAYQFGGSQVKTLMSHPSSQLYSMPSLMLQEMMSVVPQPLKHNSPLIYFAPASLPES